MSATALMRRSKNFSTPISSRSSTGCAKQRGRISPSGAAGTLLRAGVAAGVAVTPGATSPIEVNKKSAGADQHRRFFYCLYLGVIGVGVAFAFPEILLDLALQLFSTAFDVLAGVVGRIADVASDLSLHLFGGAFDLVLQPSFV